MTEPRTMRQSSPTLRESATAAPDEMLVYAWRDGCRSNFLVIGCSVIGVMSASCSQQPLRAEVPTRARPSQNVTAPTRFSSQRDSLDGERQVVARLSSEELRLLRAHLSDSTAHDIHEIILSRINPRMRAAEYIEDAYARIAHQATSCMASLSASSAPHSSLLDSVHVVVSTNGTVVASLTQSSVPAVTCIATSLRAMRFAPPPVHVPIRIRFPPSCHTWFRAARASNRDASDRDGSSDDSADYLFRFTQGGLRYAHPNILANSRSCMRRMVSFLRLRSDGGDPALDRIDNTTWPDP